MLGNYYIKNFRKISNGIFKSFCTDSNYTVQSNKVFVGGFNHIASGPQINF